MYTESKRSHLAVLAASFVPHFGAGHQDRVERMDEDVHRVFLFNTELWFNRAEIRLGLLSSGLAQLRQSDTSTVINLALE